METTSSPQLEPAMGYGRHRLRRAVGDLTVTVTRHRVGLRTPTHTHTWACVHYVLGGVYREAVPGAARSLSAGDLLFKPPAERHWNELGERGSWTLRLEIPASRFAAMAGLPARSTRLDDPALGVLAERLALATTFCDRYSESDGESLMTELIDGLAGRARCGSGRRAAALVRRCVELIEERDPEPLGLTEAAGKLDVHRAHLARVFRRQTGSTLGEYQRLRRLRWALQRLRAGAPEGLADLAAGAGYSDQSHLTRSVRAAAGLPPGVLRSLWR